MAAPGLRQRKSAQVKQALFASAMKLFRKNGFEATSVEQIAGRAGFSRATFFNHFGTKDGILRYYGERVAERMERLLAEAEPGTGALEKVRRMVFEMGREAEAHREELRLIYLFSLQDPRYLREPTPARQRVANMVSELLGEAQRAGEVRRDLRAPELASHVLSVYAGVVAGIVHGSTPARASLDSAWSFILEGCGGSAR